MTDNEIIKALDCCANSSGFAYCDRCLYSQHKYCVRVLMQDVSDLIKRQQAEIERLKEETDKWKILDKLVEELERREK